MYITDFIRQQPQTDYTDNFERESKLISGLLGQKSANEEINNAVLEGAKQNKQQYEQAQLLNGLARTKLVPQIIAAKELYGKADNAETQAMYGMDADKIKEYAHNNAELARRKAMETGVDISPYGAGVKLQDAINNLDVNDYKALNELMYGEYGKNSEEYYQDRYYHWRNQGYNDHDARVAAGGEASRYKAKRMSEMMNGIETYGITPNGALNQQAIQMLARALPDDDNGVLATFANAFATPKDEYNNENARQAAEANYLRQLGLLDKNHQYDFENREHTAQLNQKYYKFTSDIDTDTYGKKRGIDYSYGEAEKDNELIRKVKELEENGKIARRQRMQEMQDRIALNTDIANKLGLTGTDRAQFIYGVNLSKKDDSVRQLKEIHDMMTNRLKALSQGDEITTSPEIEAQKEQLNNNISEIENVVLQKYGINLKNAIDEEPQYNGKNYDEIEAYVFKKAAADGVDMSNEENVKIIRKRLKEQLNITN